MSALKVSASKDDKVVRLSVNDGTVTSEVEIYRFGAHVTKWSERANDGKEEARSLLFLSKKAKLDGSKAIRGGIPVIFPQFSGKGPIKKSHGFGRIQEWKLLGVEEGKEGAAASFSLSPNALSEELWGKDKRFEVVYKVALTGARNSKLAISWELRNTGAASFQFAMALHTYFNVADVESATVVHAGGKSLEGHKYVDQLADGKVVEHGSAEISFGTKHKEIDRVYMDGPDELLLRAGHIGGPKGQATVVSMRKPGAVLKDWVVWNPWTTGSKGKSDLGEDEYIGFVCVEPLSGFNKMEKLAPGATWAGTYELRSAL